MPAKTIYVHAGLAKTGSSALQRAVAAGRQRLAAAGVESWSVAPNHGMPLAIMLDIGEVGPMGPDLWRLDRYRLPDPEALRRSLFKEIEAAEDVFLLTGELIPAFGHSGLRKLRDLLTSTGAEVRVLAYVREPRAWFASYVQQMIKVGRTLEEAVGTAGGVFRGASRLADTFGAHLSVRLYRPYPTPEGLFGDFLEALGRDPALAGELDVRWDNTGLSHRAIVLWEAMNRLVRAEGLPALNWVTTARYLGASMPGPAFRLPAATLEAGVSEQADAVALASKQVGIDLTALPAPAEGGADLDWRPAEDHVRTVHALLVDLAQAQALSAYRHGRMLLVRGDEPGATRAFVGALAQAPSMPEPIAALERLRRRRSASRARRVAAGRPARREARAPAASELEEIERLGHRNFVGALWEKIGRLQLDFLSAEGLSPHQVLLDVGCGALRGGVHFIDYLDPGHYLGLDQHRELIDRGISEEAGEALIRAKAPEFVVSSEFEFDRFSRVPDVAIAQSLFTHLTADDCSTCLDRLRRYVPAGCRFYATFFEAPEPVDNPAVSGSRIMFHYTRAELESLARAHGWHPQYLGKWNHPRDQMMIRFVAA